MEPGTLELQVFVSLIVILATGFVALVCDYLKGNNEQLREHNIELRVRREEQEKQRPLEAIQWIQHLLGATPRNPIRVGTPRPVARPAAVGRAPVREAVRPMDAVRPAGFASPIPVKPAPMVPRVVEPQVSQVAETRLPLETPAAVFTPLSESARGSRLSEVRERPRTGGSTNELLESLPVPAWVRKEHEEKAAVAALRALREQAEPAADLETASPYFQALRQTAEAHRREMAPEPVLEAPKPVLEVPKPVVETPKPVLETSKLVPQTPPKSDTFWTYRGLLDKVVAATTSGRPKEDAEDSRLEAEEERVAESPATGAGTASVETELVQLTQSPAGGTIEQITTVAIDVPAHPTEETSDVPAAETSVTFAQMAEAVEQAQPSQEKEETVADILGGWAAKVREEDLVPEVLVPEALVVESPKLPTVPEVLLPAGFHDRAVLTGLLQSMDVLVGVVVAISINDYQHHKEKMGVVPMQELMRSVETMIRGLLREGIDFGCRSAEDEFVLVFARETGPDAQRRLSSISERLWNFQLRSLSSFSVLFSWGAVEVQGETLADAAASASERMYQTKRNRKTISMDPQRRKLAVNL